MTETQKKILDDYEAKSIEIETIKDDISYILSTSLLIGDDANSIHAKALSYDQMQAHIPNLINLLNYKVSEMKTNLDKLYKEKEEAHKQTQTQPNVQC